MPRFYFSALVATSALILTACATPEPQTGKEPARVTEGDVVTGSRLARKSSGTGQTVKTLGGRETADALRGTMENRPQGM